MRRLLDDCWPPRPGSWEEAVDPYDEQLTRFEPKRQKDEQTDTPLELFIERQSDMRIPASA